MKRFPPLSFGRWMGWCLVLSVTLPVGRAQMVVHPQPEIITVAQMEALEREDKMWRIVQIGEDVEPNVARWRAAGCRPQDIETLQPVLVALWHAPAVRNFGWLREDTVNAIRAIDQEFTIRLRAARLFRHAGLRLGKGPWCSDATMNRLWRRAILRVLPFDEIAEFRLMNSPTAQEVGRLVEELALTMDEQRTLCEWQRDFDGAHERPTGFSNSPQWQWWHEAQLEHRDNIRTLLGDHRYTLFLLRIEPQFGSLQQALERTTSAREEVVLDIWRLRKKSEIERARAGGWGALERIEARTTRQMRELLGETDWARYSATEDARWLPTRALQVAAKE